MPAIGTYACRSFEKRLERNLVRKRQTEMRRGLTTVLLVGVVLSACSDAAPNAAASPTSSLATTETSLPLDTSSTTSLPAAPTGGLFVPECNDVDLGVCAAGFVLDDGMFYNLSCSAVRDSAVSEEVIGEGEFEGEMVVVHTLETVPRSVMIAVSLPGGLCAEGDQVLSDWSMAFPQGANQESLTEAICDVGELSAAQREANGC